MKWAAVLLCVIMSACGSVAPRGRLVIAGGAVKADNERIYSAFVRGLGPDAVIGVVPTASASAAESAASSARTLERHAAGRRIVQLDLPSDKPANAFDPNIVAQIDECSALWFTGGVQSRILRVFRPESGDSPAYQAALRLLGRGGTIGGTSAGAAMMSDPMITGGSSEEALLGNFRTSDEDSGLGIGRGMGFFPFGLTDQHFLRRGRIGRLIVALEQTGLTRGYGVEENSAIIVDLATGSIEVAGSAVVVSMTSASRLDGVRDGVRVSLLRTGDGIEGATGSVAFGPEVPEGQAAVQSNSRDAWATGSIESAIVELATDPGRAAARESKGFTVRMEADDQTRFAGTGPAVRAEGVKLQILPRATP